MSMHMTPHEMEQRIVRYGALKPCKTAFIDTYTPGSDQKENFAIIGSGVSENPEQHVHIQDTPGFNIGAAGQPPGCRNSLHAHRTAEVFFVLKGRWRFFWGRFGTAGEVVLEEGDIFNIPTGIFRGFENIGSDYGMIMAILGGDDAGGGVIWAPQVIEEARRHGLVLGDNGQIYDSKQYATLPRGVQPMPLLNAQELAAFAEPRTAEIVRRYVARYWDLVALADRQPADVIGEHALLRDKPGFEVQLLVRGSLDANAYSSPRHEILIPVKGRWNLVWEGGKTVLNPGDTCAVLPGLSHAITPAMRGHCAMYKICNTDDPAGPTWNTHDRQN